MVFVITIQESNYIQQQSGEKAAEHMILPFKVIAPELYMSLDLHPKTT